MALCVLCLFLMVGWIYDCGISWSYSLFCHEDEAAHSISLELQKARSREYNNPHACPCRIEISHPRGPNFNQGRGLPHPWLNSNPEGEISLSYMDRLMMDCFSPTFPRFFIGT